jgi:lysophospholipase L1-like esterase
VLLAPDRKIVFVGDSITDCGRARPIGEGLNNALGNGYVSFIDAFLGATKPELRLRVVNMGESGNTVRDLEARWKRDVLDLRPQYVSCMIGINDVWRQFDSPLQKEIHVGPEEYRDTLDRLIASTTPHVERVLVASPFYIEPNKQDRMRARMDEYGAYANEVAIEHGAIFVDVQAAFDQVLKHVHPNALAWDRVHPNATGHAIITRAFLKLVGVQWPA